MPGGEASAQLTCAASGEVAMVAPRKWRDVRRVGGASQPRGRSSAIYDAPHRLVRPVGEAVMS